MENDPLNDLLAAKIKQESKVALQQLQGMNRDERRRLKALAKKGNADKRKRLDALIAQRSKG